MDARMIVRNQSDGSVVMITQNDHAKLAGLFAAHWGNAHFARPQPFASAVRAAQYHDTGWFRYETDPRFDPATGTTPTYQQVPNDAEQLAAYQWAVDMLAGVDTYTGILVSKHRTGLWQSRYSVMTSPPPGPPRTLSAEVQDFIARNEAWQTRAAASADAQELAINYNLLQVWDLMSLYICSNEQLKDCTIAPTPTGYADGGKGVAMKLVPTEPGRISAAPYPFDRASLEVGVVFRQLQRGDLRDRDTFRAAYFAARPQVANFTFIEGAA
jgi:hypothetical protein